MSEKTRVAIGAGASLGIHPTELNFAFGIARRGGWILVRHISDEDNIYWITESHSTNLITNNIDNDEWLR